MIKTTPFLLVLALICGMAASTAQAAASKGVQAQPTPPGTVKSWTINIQSADIRAFINQVADMTGKNFVLDPRVSAKDVTVISRTPLTKSEVYQLFLAVLQVNGYAAIPSDDVVKIVPSTTAKSYSLPVVKGGTGQGLVTEVLPLHNLSATEMVPVLRPLVPQDGHLAAVASANALVVSDHENNIRRLAAIISRLEQQGQNGLSVIKLHHAWVGDVVEQLKVLIPKAATGGKRNARAAGGNAVIVADERTNRLLVRGDAIMRHRIRNLVDQLDVKASRRGNIQVIRLEHGNAKEMAKLLSDFFGNQKKSKKNSAVEVSIQADESLNALVVRANNSKMKQVRNVIRQLDVRRAQVLIEAAIIEVSANKAENLGIQWATGDVDTGIGGTNLTTGGQLSTSDIVTGLLASNAGAAVAPPALAQGLTAGFGELGDDGRLEWAGLIQALATDSSVNLLSTPSILTLDNEEAKIMVGENVPFVTGTSTSTGAGISNPFQTIQRQDVGITLEVTPHLSDGNSMRLELNQEISSVKDSSASVSTVDITTSKRQIKTTVLADSGETIVLGGLIQDDIKEVQHKVPILGDIPLLGVLFRSTKHTHVRSNLIVFLRPTIVHDNDKLVALTRNRYYGLLSLQFKLNDRGELERVAESPLPFNVGNVFNGRTPPPNELRQALRKKANGMTGVKPQSQKNADVTPAEPKADVDTAGANAKKAPAPSESTGSQ